MSKLKTLKDVTLQFTSTSRLKEDDIEYIYSAAIGNIRQAARECIKQQAIGNDPWLNKYPEGNSDEAFIKWFFNLEDD